MKERNISRKTGSFIVLRRILHELRPQLPLIILSLACAAVSVFLTLLIPILTGRAVDCIAGRGAVDFSRLARLTGQIGVSIGISAAASWCMNHINNLITFRVVRKLRETAFGHMQHLPLSWLDTHGSGDLLSRVVTDAEQFSDGLLMGFTQLFTGVLTIAGTIVFMLTINTRITLVVILASPLSFLIARFVSGRTFRLFQQQSQSRGELTAYTNEMLENLKLVKTFDRNKPAQAEFDRINSRLGEQYRKATFYSSLTNPTTRLMYSMIYAAVTIAGCLLCISSGGSALSVGMLSSFLGYTNQYTRPFNEITGVITEFQNAIASAQRVFELIDEKPESPDPAESLSRPVEGTVDIEDVSFSYLPERPLIEHLNLHVSAGRRIAIVGPTGSGKTTLINLLMRFYDVNSGRILVDGADIRSMSRYGLRKRFGMVLQDTWLKSATVRENITYGSENASEEDVIRAAEQAHAHDFIMRMPDGYDTVLGEDGGTLSAGQRQLLCIARVMLNLPPILILDEATSSIDTMTELRIQDAFDRMMKERTSFIVAHRLSTIRSADLILVMKRGHVIEQGTHEELLAQNGFYAELYRAAFEQTETKS